MEGDAAVLSDTAPVDVKKQSASAGTSNEAARQDHVHNLDLSSSSLSELGAPTGDLAMANHKITGLGAGTAEGDAVALDVNLRAPDSTLLEGSTKAEVQNHAPQSHATSHKSGGADEILLNELGDPTGDVNFNQKQALAMVLEVLSEDPSTPVDGQIYFNTTDNHPYIYVPA
ncbi:MAG: hypothetical protein ACTSPB_02455 [Candidatus Thorarchaeota archaeon]